MRYKAARTVIAVATVAVSLFVPGTGHAQICHLEGINYSTGDTTGSYKVATMSLPSGRTVGFSWRQSNPTAIPWDDDNNHVQTFGVYIVPFGGTSPVFWVVNVAGENAPRAVVNVNGKTYVNEPVPGMNFGYGGVQGGYSGVRGGLSSGNYYVIAFGTGVTEGLRGAGPWQVDVDAAADCTEINVPGAEIFTYNETDFSPKNKFSSHIHTPWFGAGSLLKLEHHQTHKQMYGTAYSAADGGKTDLRWSSTYGEAGRIGTVVNNGIHYVNAGEPGDSTFLLDYAGANALNNVSLLELDLPL